MPTPIQITLLRASHVLEVRFEDGESFRMPAEYLRVNSPSAEVQGHGPGQKVLVDGKADVNIDEIVPVGNYAVLLKFSDGHHRRRHRMIRHHRHHRCCRMKSRAGSRTN